MITLVGYMGSGKSLIANELALLLNLKKNDLDEEISNRVGLSVADIFEKKGEIFFRKVEKEVLEELLLEGNLILSVGGGTPCYYNNMEVINQHSVSIYLRAKVKTLVERLKSEKEKRPLIAKITNDHLPEFIGQHLFERNYFYNQAKIVIDTDNLTPKEIAEQIYEKIKNEMIESE